MLTMRFTRKDYIAQGLCPPCEGAEYIPSSSPVAKGDQWLDRATCRLYVAWEQQVMKTGGVYESRLWWVPVDRLKEVAQ